MCTRLHSEGMLTDVHNWLRCFLMVSKVCKGHKKKSTPLGWISFCQRVGIRKDGTSAHTGAKKCPVDTSLVRGRIHILMNAPSMGVDMRILFVIVGYRNNINSVQETQKYPPPIRVGDIFARVRDSKVKSKLPAVAWSIPAGWHRHNYFLHSRKCKRISNSPRRLRAAVFIDGVLKIYTSENRFSFLFQCIGCSIHSNRGGTYGTYNKHGHPAGSFTCSACIFPHKSQ